MDYTHNQRHPNSMQTGYTMQTWPETGKLIRIHNHWFKECLQCFKEASEWCHLAEKHHSREFSRHWGICFLSLSYNNNLLQLTLLLLHPRRPRVVHFLSPLGKSSSNTKNSSLLYNRLDITTATHGSKKTCKSIHAQRHYYILSLILDTVVQKSLHTIILSKML